MKKLLCLLFSLLLMLSAASAELYVPLSTTKLPAMPEAPVPPEIIRVQHRDGFVILTFDTEWPDGSTCTAHYIANDDHRITHVNAQPMDGCTLSAEAPMTDGWWSGFDLAWTSDGDAALARYNSAGGLETVARYDSRGNAYIYDNDLRFREFADARSGVHTRYDTRGVLLSYGYEAFRDLTVWFSAAGNVVCGEYDDGSFAADWEPEIGWFVTTPAGRDKVKLGVSPWDAKPLLTPQEDAAQTERTHYPSNTICVAGLTLQEADPSLPDKWYNVLPVDLTREGRQTCYLMISNMFLIGRCYVDVWGDEVTVSCSLIDHPAVKPLSSYGRWFISLEDITAASIESDENGFVFGEPLSISGDLDGADTALLFIRSKATYYQPFRDGSTLTRYWRNKAEWKEFRKGLQELLPRVEK